MAETSGCPHKTDSLSCTHTDFEARLRLLLQQAAMSHSLQPDCHTLPGDTSQQRALKVPFFISLAPHQSHFEHALVLQMQRALLRATCTAWQRANASFSTCHCQLCLQAALNPVRPALS